MKAWIPTSRTFWLNAITLAGMFLADRELVELLGPNGLMWALKGQAAVNIILRFVTSGPVQTMAAPK